MPGQVMRFHVRSEDILSQASQQKGQQDTWRLDKFLISKDSIACSRSQVRKLICDGGITVNGRRVKPGYRVKEADSIVIALPEPRQSGLTAEDIPLNILFEDDALLVINKPAGMVVHPAPGHHRGTLVHALLHHCPDLPGIGGELRPGIVHRLDRDTSGVMLVAKTQQAHHSLSEQIHWRSVSRQYAAIVHGRLRRIRGTIEAPIGRHRKDRKKMAVDAEKGRDACSEYQVIEQYQRHALLSVKLHTGRTHQIRVHLKSIHHPVVGDQVYGDRSKPGPTIRRQALHARKIRFQHPVSGEHKEFEAPLPDDMQQALEKLRGL